MTSWTNCPTDVANFVNDLITDITRICAGTFTGGYLHGSLAMGGFNPQSSDIDILVVTNRSVTLADKRHLAELFLERSGHPYPIEISILTEQQLLDWKHPSPYEFHYSEMWRTKYELALTLGSQEFFDHRGNQDVDLAAHLTVTKERGICLSGKPISEAIPFIPREHYLDSILSDFHNCLDNIIETPIYSVLNLVRVYLFAKAGLVSSKIEAGEWALLNLPEEFEPTIQKVVEKYSNARSSVCFSPQELTLLRDYVCDLRVDLGGGR
ncbi:DUF4111 domain-containing protein [Alicyclobacillus curvatus]|nr:DUF4111 domain-containing protein [Alicyclobacillus curvatus]